MTEDITKVMLLLCDKRIETEVRSLVGDIQGANGKIMLKTMTNVPDARGKNFSEKLEGILNWSKAVVIICTDNLAVFFDKKDKSNCTDIIVKNDKDCLKILKNFIEKQMKLSPNKLVLASIAGDHKLPKILNGMPVITKQDGNNAEFIRHIISQIEGK